MRNKRNSKEEWIYDTFSDDVRNDGDVAHGSVGERCYRSAIGGETPSSCELGVRRDGDVIKYNCFSDACQCRGRVENGEGSKGIRGRGVSSGVPVRHGVENKEQEASVRLLIPPTAIRWCPRQCGAYLEANNISQAAFTDYDMRWDAANGRLIIPLPRHQQMDGYVSRLIQRTGGRKWVNMTSDGAIFTNILIAESSTEWLREQKMTLYIVEAPTSAISLGEKGLATCALMGLSLTETKLANILSCSRKLQSTNVVFIPDMGVARSTIKKIKRKLTNEGLHVTVKQFDKKPRYLSKEELEK